MNELANPLEEQTEKPENESSNQPAPLQIKTSQADLDDTNILPIPPDDPTSPLEPIAGIAKVAGLPTELTPIIEVTKRCHVGAIRERNEDSCIVFMSETGGHFSLMPFGLYIVADGMGGHQNGHVASKTASRMVARNVINKIYTPLLQDESSPVQTPIQEVMTEAFRAAHQSIYNPDPEEDGGTTLTAALILGRRLYIAHVGDSRAYLKTENKFEPLTTDHSLVQRLQDVGQLTAEEATFYQYRHILLRALGQGEEDIEVDTYMRLLPKSGILLLCSDGLSGLVSDNTMQDILQRELSLNQKADVLFETAMAAGGYDNITFILVDFRI